MEDTQQADVDECGLSKEEWEMVEKWRSSPSSAAALSGTVISDLLSIIAKITAKCRELAGERDERDRLKIENVQAQLKEATDTFNELNQLRNDLAAAREWQAEMGKFLRDIEWNGKGCYAASCPQCAGYECDGHTDTCRLAALLASAMPAATGGEGVK